MKKLMVVVALVALFVGGCMQTIHGIALDIESTARYTADHTVADR